MWPIQEKLLDLSSIIHDYGETARRGDNEFLTFLVSVAATLSSGRYIIEVISTTYWEWDVFLSFDKGKIAPVIHNFW